MNVSSRRIACVALFHLRVGVARERESGPTQQIAAPLAIVVGTQTERELQGGSRIDEVSPEAFALGVRAGMTVAAARARAAHLCVRVVRPEAVEAALARLAESLLSFGATTSYELAGAGRTNDAVYVDVSGCAHLHATAEDPSGEHVLAARLGAHVARIGLPSRVAVASGPRIAHAVARWAPSRLAKPLPVVVLSGTEREAVGALPLAALPLDDDTFRYLRKLGLEVVSDLLTLPADALGSRLGPIASEVLGLARGDDRKPLTAYLPPESPEERIELDDPVERTDALLFIAKTLTDRMGARIQGRGLRASALDLIFELERSLVPEGQSPRAELSLDLAAPIGAPAELLAIVRARLESYEVIAPIKTVVLRCRDLAPARGRPLALFEAEPKADRVLPELAAELTTLLGKDNVGVLVTEDTWNVAKRTTLVPFAEARKDARVKRGAGLSWAGEEPLRLVGRAIPHEIPSVAPLVVRLDSVEWWRARARAHKTASNSKRDFVVAWDEEVGALAWLEIDRASGRAWLRGWKE